jgi:hypothetical protein
MRLRQPEIDPFVGKAAEASSVIDDPFTVEARGIAVGLFDPLRDILM